MAWDAHTTSSESNITADSGWLDVPNSSPDSLWSNTPSALVGPEPQQSIDFLLPSTVTEWFSVQLYVRDDQTATSPVSSQLVTSPDGYLQLGVFGAGPSFSPSRVNFRHGPFLSVHDPSTHGETLGGQEYGSRRRARRQMSIALPRLTWEEGFSIFDRIDWRGGTKSPCYVVAFPEDATAAHHTSLWATVRKPRGLEIPLAFQRLGWAGTFREKL